MLRRPLSGPTLGILPGSSFIVCESFPPPWRADQSARAATLAGQARAEQGRAGQGRGQGRGQGSRAEGRVGPGRAEANNRTDQQKSERASTSTSTGASDSRTDNRNLESILLELSVCQFNRRYVAEGRCQHS